MRPKLSTRIDEFLTKVAMDRDRRAEARAAAGLGGLWAPRAASLDGDSRPPITHRVPSDVREYVIPDFRPTVDKCSVELRTSDVEVMHWQGPGGSVLCVDDEAEQVVIVFLGLGELPFDDIAMAYPRRADGPKPRFEAQTLTPDDLAAHLVSATPFAAPSGQGALAEFWAFDAESEVVEIMRAPDREGEARVTVAPTPDGRDAMVIIDGQATAILRGAPSASKRNVRVVASAEI